MPFYHQVTNLAVGPVCSICQDLVVEAQLEADKLLHHNLDARTDTQVELVSLKHREGSHSRDKI